MSVEKSKGRERIRKKRTKKFGASHQTTKSALRFKQYSHSDVAPILKIVFHY